MAATKRLCTKCVYRTVAFFPAGDRWFGRFRRVNGIVYVDQRSVANIRIGNSENVNSVNLTYYGIFINMLMFILMLNCLPVRSTEDTGSCVNKNECIKPVFYNNINSRSCNNNNYELSSVKYPAVKTSEKVEKRGFENFNSEESFSGKKNSPWLGTINTCQQQNTNDDPVTFKNPEYIWGKDFNTSVAKTVCESCVFARGSNVECIRFTKKGMQMCSKVCNKQEQNILRTPPTTVVLRDNYCTKKRLRAATCVCVYKVTCQEYNHFVFIHFIPNRAGAVAVLYFEAGHPIITNLDNI